MDLSTRLVKVLLTLASSRDAEEVALLGRLLDRTHTPQDVSRVADMIGELDEG